MTPANAIAKGKLLENFIVERLKSTGIDIRASRTPGSGNGLAKGDIATDINVAFEAKNQKRFSPEWLKQSEKQATNGQAWAVIWHPPHVPMESSVAIIPWWHYEELLGRSRAPLLKQEDRTLRYKIETLKRSATELLKELP